MEVRLRDCAHACVVKSKKSKTIRPNLFISIIPCNRVDDNWHGTIARYHGQTNNVNGHCEKRWSAFSTSPILHCQFSDLSFVVKLGRVVTRRHAFSQG